LRDIIKKLPKRRGYGKNRARTVNTRTPKPVAISLARLDATFESGVEISPLSLRERGMLRRIPTPVKIVGGAQVSKKFVIKGIAVSGTARAAIEKAGGSVA